MRRFRLFAPVVGLLAAMALTACSGTEANLLSIGGLRDAAENSQAANSMRFRMDMRIDVGGQTLRIEGSGVSSGDGTHAGMRFELQDVPQLPAGLAFELRLVDETMYFDLGALATLAPGWPEGKRWIRAGLDDLGAAAGGQFGALLEQAKQSSPTSGLEFLQGLSGDVRVVGHDFVAGNEATHYRAELDFAELADRADVELPAELLDAFQSLGRIPVDVWVDDHDRVVKMRYRMDGGPLDAGGAVEITFEIVEFDVPVDVVAPPDNEIIGFTEFLGIVGSVTA